MNTSLSGEAVERPAVDREAIEHAGLYTQQPAARIHRDGDARGQTETFAALVAVVTICVAVSVYAGFLSSVVPDLGDQRSLGEGTAERVWTGLNDQGYYNSSTAVTDRLDPASLPAGHFVAINVTYVGSEGRLESVGNATFNPQGESTGLTPPASAERYERPVPVKIRPADIRPGTLEVVVWS